MALGQLFAPGEGYGGHQTFARRPPGYVNTRVLAASTVETAAIPTGARYVIFSASGDFYARPDAAAAIPAADVTDGTASELNPAMWDLSGVTDIRLIAGAATVVTLSFYSG